MTIEQYYIKEYLEKRIEGIVMSVSIDSVAIFADVFYLGYKLSFYTEVMTERSKSLEDDLEKIIKKYQTSDFVRQMTFKRIK